MNKKTHKEINIISNSPKRRPYASKITIVLEEGFEYGFDGETCLLLDGDFLVRIKPETEKTKHDKKNLQQITAIIEGFNTARKAEEMGLRLTLALLWTAISKKWHLKLNYHTPQPCLVFDRTQSRDGIRLSGRAYISVRTNANEVIKLINEIISKHNKFDQRLLISMELFTSARLESTDRAKFIGLVSSLEPLAIQEKFNNQELDELISSFISGINDINSLTDNVKDSIGGRALSLAEESILQSILRFVKEYFPQKPEIIRIVKEAYNIRSSILHDGTFDADLDEKGNELEEIIRYIYSQILEKELTIPAKKKNQWGQVLNYQFLIKMKVIPT